MVVVRLFSNPVFGRIVTSSLFAIGIAGFANTLVDRGVAPKVEYVRDIQPIFAAHCQQCHSATTKMGKLALDSAQAVLKGSSSGTIVTPGKPEQSVLLDRILGKGGQPRMPMGFGPLSDKDIATIRAWIEQGCDTRGAKRAHWAYVAPVRPKVPAFPNSHWIRNPIDSFVYKKQLEAHLVPSPEADRETLIRRLSLDLTGLPPTLEEVDHFVSDKSPNAYDQVVDRLLASAHYGERMALPWLDAARYSDSNGFQQDGDNYQYVWRDWVVNALNSNMPFDQFTTEQLAGDLLPGVTTGSIDGLNKLVATGFVRDNMLNNEGGAIPEEQRNVELFDRVDTCSTTFLGLTMACARCHDHKYDPLSQKDYYSMLAFFNNVPETGIPSDTIGGYYIAKPWVYAGSSDEMAKLHSLEPATTLAEQTFRKFEKSPQAQAEERAWESKASKDAAIPKEISAVLMVASEKRKSDASNRLHEYYLANGLAEPGKSTRKKWLDLRKELEDLKTALPKVMVMSDRQPRKAHVFSRGNYESPLSEVFACTPASLPPMPPEEPKNRLGLAKWIVSPSNPLTARVQVNRYWQLFFGKGLVKTPENFGVQSEPPLNPELLDWLAVEFREGGWNVKKLQRLIVTSATYRQTSKVSRALYQKDPENRYFARGARFRMPSLIIRDAALASSGLINLKMGGKPVYPYQPKGIWDGLAITDERDFTYPQSKGSDLYRRSIYTFWRRTVGPGNMFDAGSRQVCTVRPSQTSTPLHALITMNDVTWVEAGRALAEKVIMSGSHDPMARLSDAFRRVCARRPNSNELKILKRSLDRSLAAFRADPKVAETYLHQGERQPNASIEPIENAAYSNVCAAILNLDEALTRE